MNWKDVFFAVPIVMFILTVTAGIGFIIYDIFQVSMERGLAVLFFVVLLPWLFCAILYFLSKDKFKY